MTTKVDRYRIEFGTIFEYEEDERAYFAMGSTSAYSKKELAFMKNETITIGEDDE